MPNGYNSANYNEQGGSRLVIGGEIDIVSGGALKIAGTDITSDLADLSGIGDEIAGLANRLGGATINVGADAGTTVTINIQLEDADGDDIAVRTALFAYLSDDANGDSVAATAPDGGVAAGTDGILIPVVAGKAFYLVSEADGDIDIVVTESGTDTWYLILVMPDGNLVASAAITFAA